MTTLKDIWARVAENLLGFIRHGKHLKARLGSRVRTEKSGATQHLT